MIHWTDGTNAIEADSHAPLAEQIARQVDHVKTDGGCGRDCGASNSIANWSIMVGFPREHAGSSKSRWPARSGAAERSG